VRRFIRTVSVTVACLASSLAISTAAAGAAQAPAAAPAACATSQTIQITSLAFQPPAVAPGGTSQATASLLNCTAQQQKASAEWLGSWVSATGAFPPGCPAIDPLLLGVTLAPHAQATSTVGYLVPSSCTAAALVVTVKIIQNGTVIAQRSATLEIIQQTTAPARVS
jgi:hypothetical protein